MSLLLTIKQYSHKFDGHRKVVIDQCDTCDDVNFKVLDGMRGSLNNRAA